MRPELRIQFMQDALYSILERIVIRAAAGRLTTDTGGCHERSARQPRFRWWLALPQPLPTDQVPRRSTSLAA